MLCAAWGHKITSDGAAKKGPKREVVDLSEKLTPDVMSDVQMPVSGGDTLAASRAILAKLQAMNGG